MNVTIVKLGGSLARSDQRGAWLTTLAAWGGPLVLVPGGGPFADAVRKAQGEMGFDDAAAHRMALLAMEQFGVVLAAHAKAFALTASCAEMEGVLRDGGLPVWLPTSMVLGASDAPACWDATSDSLSAWLAAACAAPRLLIIKSRDCDGAWTTGDLAAHGIVDPLFPRFAARANAEIAVAGPSALPGALEILRGGGLPGACVALN